MEVLSNWLARLTVNQVPSGHAGSTPVTSTQNGYNDSSLLWLWDFWLSLISLVWPKALPCQGRERGFKSRMSGERFLVSSSFGEFLASEVQMKKLVSVLALWVSVHPLHGSCAEFKSPGDDCN